MLGMASVGDRNSVESRRSLGVNHADPPVFAITSEGGLEGNHSPSLGEPDILVKSRTENSRHYGFFHFASEVQFKLFMA